MAYNHKEVIAKRFRIPLIACLSQCSFLRGMSQQRIHCTQHNIGTISAGNGDISRHNPRNRMKSHPLKQHGGNRQQDNTFGVISYPNHSTKRGAIATVGMVWVNTIRG